jgi:hypothetical protein
VADVARKLYPHLPEPPEAEPSAAVDDVSEAARLPIYAAVEIRSASEAALALASLRKRTSEAGRDMFTWSDAGSERGAAIVRVAMGRPEAAPSSSSQVVVFYCLTEKALFISPDEAVLRRLLAESADGRAPRSVPTGATPGEGSQLVFDLAAQPRGGLLTVLGWLLSERVSSASSPGRVQAEALLRGVPDRPSDPAALRALSFAYFGRHAAPPFGGSYTLGPDGVRDPLRGTASSPIWPPLPASGSDVERWLKGFGRLRVEVGFEPDSIAKDTQTLHFSVAMAKREPPREDHK